METDYIGLIKDVWEEDLLRDQWTPRVDPLDYVYASQRRSCVRRMCLDLTHPGDRELPSTDALERMRKGQEREAMILSRLQRLGPMCKVPFEVVGGQTRYEIKDRDGRILAVGKNDGRLKFRDGTSPIFEVKAGVSVQRVETVEDFDNSPWTKHMPDQLLSYLLGEGEPLGFFILDRPGLPHLLPIKLEDHMDRAESFLRDARVAVDHRFDGTPLPEYTQDVSECRICDHFGKSCTPDLSFGEGVQIITDQVLIDAAKVFVETHEAALVNARVKKKLAGALRGCEYAVLGNVEATGKWTASTKYDVPVEIKNQYKVRNPQGKFGLKYAAIPE